MPLLPLHLILTVGASAAVFVFGVMIWSRKTSDTGHALFALLAMCFAVWTSADWILQLQSSAGVIQIVLWKILFYACAVFGPALALHTALHIGRRPHSRPLSILYGVSFFTWLAISYSFVVRVAQIPVWPWEMSLMASAYVGVALYVCAGFILCVELYPILHSASTVNLERRRAAYGIMILIPFVVAGILQFVIGPLPTGFTMPFLVTWFVVFSMIAFIRSSLFEVVLPAFECFFLFLLSFSVVIVLRSRDITEALVSIMGAVFVGVFGAMASRSVRKERTRREHAETMSRQLRYIEEARTDFIDMVAHQLRGPIGGIRSAASMLVAGDYGSISPQAQKASGLIQDSASRLLSLAETFLSASRLEVGQYESKPEKVSIAQEIDKVILEMQSAATGKGLKLGATISPEVPSHVVLDPEVLRQSIFNLIDNAIKYTDHGEVHVTCDIEQGYIHCEVRDTGAGLTAQEITQLFRKFHRGRAGHRHAIDGTGLGLFIVKHLLETVGGRIEVRSPGEGQGTTFEMYLPYSVRGV